LPLQVQGRDARLHCDVLLVQESTHPRDLELQQVGLQVVVLLPSLLQCLLLGGRQGGRQLNLFILVLLRGVRPGELGRGGDPQSLLGGTLDCFDCPVALVNALDVEPLPLLTLLQLFNLFVYIYCCSPFPEEALELPGGLLYTLVVRRRYFREQLGFGDL